MKITFKDCLARKRIFRFPPAKHLVDLEIEDAESAERLLKAVKYILKSP